MTLKKYMATSKNYTQTVFFSVVFHPVSLTFDVFCHSPPSLKDQTALHTLTKNTGTRELFSLPSIKNL